MSTTSETLSLQTRWRVVEHDNRPHLLYYGVRNPPLHREQLLGISGDLAEQLSAEGVVNSSAETTELQQKGILVKREDVRTAKTPATMQVCTRCVNNDYVIPGLEFDDHGVCALCQCYARNQTPSRALFTTVTEQELRAASTRSTSRFDAMVLYTGGKDSSYMLWLLARKLNLRVLAAFWNMPYCTPAAYANITRARERMDDVEFVEWSLPLGKVRQAMQAKWREHGWPCLCPTAAFPVLYPLAAQWRIPFVFLGIEDVQASVIDYVFPPPGSAKSLSPREQTLAFLRARTLPHRQRPPVQWTDEMANYHAAVQASMPEVFADLTDLTQRAQEDEAVFLPLIARLATNEAYGTWSDAKKTIETEMGWQAPAGQNSLLHTSCRLESVKDYLQLQRFKAMRTVFMPQSLVETSAAVFFGLTSREEALAAVEELGYWRPPPILDQLAADLSITPEAVQGATDELGHSMAEWAATKKSLDHPMSATTLQMLARSEHVMATLDFVESLAGNLGFEDQETRHIRLATEEVIEFLIRAAALADNPEATLCMTLEEEANGLLIRIAHKGLPLDMDNLPRYSPEQLLDNQSMEGLNLFLAEKVMDRVVFQNRGRAGSEVIILKRKARTHIKHQMEQREVSPAAPTPPPRSPVKYTLRPARTEEAIEISRCAYLTYGYTYEEYIYYPERIVELNQTGELRSIVAVTEDERVMGHCALKFLHGRTDRAELGVLFVRPEYRGQQVGAALWRAAVDLARELGLKSIYARSVTGHRASQKLAEHNGFRDCALLLSLFPPKVELKALGGTQPGKMSGMWQWLGLTTPRPRRINPPPAWDKPVREIYHRSNIPLATPHSPLATSSSPLFREQTIPVLNVVFQEVEHIGPHPEQTINWIIAGLRRYCRCKVDTLYLALTLEEQGTDDVAAACIEQGFIFSGIIPYAFADSDALLLQYLNTPDDPFEQLTVWTDTAAFLRDRIRGEVGSGE